MDDKVLLVSLIIALAVVLIAIGPICSIWAINTIFGTEIILSFKTWCAMAWLHLILVSIKKK